jgi:hypothetical protein
MTIKENLEKIIKKEDGTNKKVILYNLSSAGLLKYGQTMLDKVRSNLEVFKESKDDIFVVFSVQTNTEEKLMQVHGELLDSYKQALEEYADSDFCMMIDYADMEDIYELCDAYYGDWGIGAWTCKQLKKPVMIQNAEIRP